MSLLTKSQLLQVIAEAKSHLAEVSSSRDREFLVAFIERHESELQHREGE